MFFGFVLNFVARTMSQIFRTYSINICIDLAIVLTFTRNILKFIFTYSHIVNIVKTTN